MKKGTIPLRFLVSLILAIVIFLPVVLFLVRCTGITEINKLKSELNKLMDTAEKLPQGGVDVAGFFLPEGYTVIFSSGPSCTARIIVKKSDKTIFEITRKNFIFEPMTLKSDSYKYFGMRLEKKSDPDCPSVHVSYQ